MTLLSTETINQSKAFIYQNGRLLERKLFAYFFESGSQEACLKALLAYQNPDGGFGNGIEPDLLCPDSSAIGAETALAVLDLLDTQGEEILDPLVDWLVANQDEAGFIHQPPRNMANYPHQPWWGSPDRNRVLVIAALLKKRRVERDDFFGRAGTYYESIDLPEPDDFYSYPFFAYLRYCGVGGADKARLDRWVTQLPGLLDKQRDHFPLFGRYWFYARDFVDRETLEGEAATFIAALAEDGGVTTPYPEMPWWRPIFTLDGLIMLKKAGFIGEK
jgi:hypothetical protein